MEKKTNKTKKLSKYIDIKFDDWQVLMDRKTAKISPIYSDTENVLVHRRRTRKIDISKLPFLLRIIFKGKEYKYKMDSEWVKKRIGYKFEYSDKNFSSWYSDGNKDALREKWQKLKNEIIK